jgi:hypothetical protein
MTLQMRVDYTNNQLKASSLARIAPDITLLSDWSTQLHKRSIGWHKGFEFGEIRFQSPR